MARPPARWRVPRSLVERSIDCRAIGRSLVVGKMVVAVAWNRTES
jgi:hypothetical protein